NLYGYTLEDPVDYPDSNGLILDTIRDLANVVHDVWNENWIDVAADAAAICGPSVPKIVKEVGKNLAK
ncbi:MAG: hypothetical protein H7833_21270, partial [Magnetococcus sp. DMHC-1]